MNFKLTKIVTALAIATAITAPAIADTGTMSNADYRQAKLSANSDYKAALKGCPATAGTERTACRKDARATRNGAYADADAKHGINASYPLQNKTPN
jgi:hypothetical protein